MRLFASLGLRSGLVALQFTLLISYSQPFLARAMQAQEKPADAVPPASSGAAASGEQQSCPLISDSAIPIKWTIETKLNTALESKRQKPGKKLWVNSVYEMSMPGCRMLADAPVYGVVTAASASKTPSSSELSLAFDATECAGHGKQPMKLMIVGVLAPRDEQLRGHDSAPTEVSGGARQISSTAALTDGYDADLSSMSPGGIKPGTVIGYKKMTLEVQGGPQCSSRFVSTDPNLVLAPGTILLLMPRTPE
jgi:hypothetical protein